MEDNILSFQVSLKNYMDYHKDDVETWFSSSMLSEILQVLLFQIHMNSLWAAESADFHLKLS